MLMHKGGFGGFCFLSLNPIKFPPPSPLSLFFPDSISNSLIVQLYNFNSNMFTSVISLWPAGGKTETMDERQLYSPVANGLY